MPSESMFATTNNLNDSLDSIYETLNDVMEKYSSTFSDPHESEKIFIELVTAKMADDCKSSEFAKKHETACYLLDCFGAYLLDQNFIKWLSKKLGYHHHSRMTSIIMSYLEPKSYSRNNKYSEMDKAEMYNFWLENSIYTVERSNGRDEIRISKQDYLGNATWRMVNDDNIEEELKILKKTGR